MLNRQFQWRLLDNFRRKSYLKYELRRRLLKSLQKNHNTPLGYRYLASFYLGLTPRRASVTQPRNRCVRSGRSWNVIRRTQYSRFVLRAEGYKGSLPGFRRMS